MSLNGKVVLNADEKTAYNNRIWDAISYCQTLEEEYSGIADDLSAQVRELKRLRTKLVQINSDLESRQQLRREAAAAVSELPDLLNMGKIFAQGMEGLLNGAGYRAVCDGLQGAVERTDSKISELREDIEYYKNQITGLEEAQQDLRSSLI